MLRLYLDGEDHIGGSSVADGNWHHVAALRKVGYHVKLYIDGRESYSVSSPKEPYNVGSPTLIGVDNRMEAFFGGVMDDVRIYEIDLAPDQIERLAGFATWPSPADGAGMISVDARLSWTAGVGALSHDVYFGTDNPPTTLIANDITNTNIYPGPLQLGLTYYWLVDENTSAGTVMGDVWSFTTHSGYALTVNVEPVACGSVTLEPPGGLYPPGTEVTLTAEPAPGWAFDYWSRALSGNTNPETIIMDSAKTVDAHFEFTDPVIYVNDDAGGLNNGSCWEDAFTDLQVALSVATAGKEIWVAAGTYKPTVEHGGSGSRYKSFQMKNGVAIYGGFAGNESDIELRDPNANETILSGDVNGDDIPGDLTTNRADNCYHVFYHNNIGLSRTAILDGFIITGGNANVYTPSSNYECGGMYNYNSSPTVSNCTFTGNSAVWGGGMYNYSSSPTVTNCTFSGNSAGYEGGGMCNYDECFPKLFNCTFSHNKASCGAGLSNDNECIAIVKNCIFWTDESSYQEIYNRPAIQFPQYIGYSMAIVSYSDIQGGWIGAGNIDANPNFIDPGYWDANGTPGDFTDDIWVNGDYHLSAGSPCIDAGSNLGVGIDKGDLDGDGITIESVPLDMDGCPRFTDDPNTSDSGVYFTPEFPIVDMVAYEYPGREPIKGDVNGDGVVDFKDVAILCGNWLAGSGP